MSWLSKYLRRKVERWATSQMRQTIELQTQIIFDAHWSNLLNSAPYADPLRLEKFGFRSYSQNDEDGIIQEIFARIGDGNSTFVEFGVENGKQTNSTLLLFKGWRGLWIECDDQSYTSIQQTFHSQIATGQLQAVKSFINAENINSLVAAAQLNEIDCFSIDIDGNDYWIWKALNVKPRVVVIEYNGKYRPPLKWVMEYNPGHRWDQSDYQGASLQSLVDLGRHLGYTLVGCGLGGVNAFFVRDDQLQGKFPVADASALYNPPRYYAGNYMLSGHAKIKVGPFKTI